MANSISAMDGPAALSAPSDPSHHTYNARAPKEMSTSKSITNFQTCEHTIMFILFYDLERRAFCRIYPPQDCDV